MVRYIRRWQVLVLIVATLAAFCLLAAAMLRTTPMYDRFQIGMAEKEAEAILGPSNLAFGSTSQWRIDEGVL